MILLFAAAGLGRAPYRSLVPILVALLGCPCSAKAEPPRRAAAAQQRNDEAPYIDPARALPRLELTDPTVTAEHNAFGTAGLHLELRVDNAEKSPPAMPHGDVFRRALSEWAEPRKPLLLNPLWAEGGNGAPKVAGTQMRLASSEDERSWWARWNSSLAGVSVSFGALMFGMVAALSLLPQSVSGWNKPNYFGLRRTFSSGPSFDYDYYYFNYLAHPYDGSEFYLAARNRNYTWWQSFLYGAAVSSTFEFVIESAYEGASWQDLWITPVSGAVIGELRWQAKKALEDDDTGKPVGTANKILYVVIDPLDAIFNL